MTNNHFFGYGFSLCIHVAAITMILTLGNLIPVEKAPIIIDFSIVTGKEPSFPSTPAATPEHQSVTNRIKPVKKTKVNHAEIEKLIKPTPPPVVEKKNLDEIRADPLPISPVIKEEPIEKKIVAELKPQEQPRPAQSEIEKVIPLTDNSDSTENDTAVEIHSTEMVNNSVDSTPDERTSYGYSKQQYLKAHFDYIKNDIQKKIIYPGIARKKGWQGRVLISFVILEDGSVIDIQIIESSGYSLLDKNAVKSVLSAAPFPTPPVKAEIIIPISYALV